MARRAGDGVRDRVIARLRRLDTPASRKRVFAMALLVGILGLFAGFSVVAGDDLWDRILPPVTPKPTLVARQATARPTQTPTIAPTSTSAPTATEAPAAVPILAEVEAPPAAEAAEVWIPASGARYHLTATCSGMKNPRAVTLEEARALGFTPCGRCNPPE